MQKTFTRSLIALRASAALAAGRAAVTDGASCTARDSRGPHPTAKS